MAEHPSGFRRIQGKVGPEKTCGTCLWSRERGPGTKKLRCVGTNFTRVEEDWLGCEYWTDPSLDCLTCGACCGAAYDVVEISRRDPVRRLQPEWVVQKGGRYQMKRRANNTCQALQPDRKCSIYADRPQCCREFQRGGSNCWFARKRLGIM